MIEVLKQMVEALEWCHGGEPVGTAEAIQSGKKLIAELESQEPVAWMDADGNVSDNNDHKCFPTPLYTASPQRTWVGLTDDEFNELYDRYVPITCYSLLIEKVEAKLKDKNT